VLKKNGKTVYFHRFLKRVKPELTGEFKSIAAGKKIAKQGLVFQLAYSVILVALATLLSDAKTGVAVALGTLLSLLPNAVFSFFAFRFSGASRSQQVARSFSQGSKVKLAMTIGLFVVAFAGLQLPPLPVFLGFFAATAIYWVAMFRTSLKK
jgi:ATP synthase protein I